MEAIKIISAPYIDNIEQARQLHEQLSAEYKMEATKKLIQGGRWIPIEEVDATTSRVIVSTSIQAIADSRLADALKVAIEALEHFNRRPSGNYDALIIGAYAQDYVQKALAKIEQIAKSGLPQNEVGGDSES